MIKSFWIYTTWPDEVEALAAAETLVAERLCGCANAFPGMTSVFRWQDKIQRETECVLVLKTTEARVTALRDRVIDLHPYDEPCFVALPIDEDHSAAGFLDWVRQSCDPER
jgi:periplasmic divalent cation tolerance protein